MTAFKPAKYLRVGLPLWLGTNPEWCTKNPRIFSKTPIRVLPPSNDRPVSCAFSRIASAALEPALCSRQAVSVRLC
jgi:hypothetical protein